MLTVLEGREVIQSLSFNELFPRIVAAKIAEGVSEKTVDTYHQHWKCIEKYINMDMTLDEISQDDINNVLTDHACWLNGLRCFLFIPD